MLGTWYNDDGGGETDSDSDSEDDNDDYVIVAYDVRAKEKWHTKRQKCLLLSCIYYMSEISCIYYMSEISCIYYISEIYLGRSVAIKYLNIYKSVKLKGWARV